MKSIYATPQRQVRFTTRPPSAESLAKWEHLRAKSVTALRAGYSVGAIVRAYEVPEHMVRHWREEAGIAPAKAGGKGRSTPAVGEVLA